MPETTLPEAGKEHFKDQGQARRQDRVEELLRLLAGNPLLDGVLIENIELDSATVNHVLHQLGREPRGWIIVRKNAYALDAEITATTDDKKLAIEVTKDVTVSMWVF